MRPQPLVVVILDGWGISFVKVGNAILHAETPAMDAFAYYFPTAAISATGAEVGLPWGEVGNSETGHRNIGAGSVQYQSLPLIDTTIKDGSFFKNKALLSAIEHAKKYGSQLHLMGLTSTGGVHSHIQHLFALLELCAKQHLKERVFIHMFTDGRDAPPQSALGYLKMLEEKIDRLHIGKIASVTGRFYAMDRNQNWDRTAAFYNAITGGPRGSGAPTPRQAIENAYAQNLSDEMILPSAITEGGEGVATIQDNDAVIFFNFRPDRARQLTQAFTTPAAVPFPTKPFKNLLFVTLMKFGNDLINPSAFVEEKAEWPLARVLSEAGLKQLHIAETEKYAHITYYLNVGYEKPFPGEEQILIPSATVASFAEKPRMEAQTITDRVVTEIGRGAFDVYFINYANADMVGHTGNFDATKEACGFVDQCLTRLYQATLGAGGALIVTADHGNAEEKVHPETGETETDHTSNPVPFHYIAHHLQRSVPRSQAEMADIFSSPIGVLADVAPTILEILTLKKPAAMTGVSLLNSLR